MLRRLTYIWMILLAATLQVAGQGYVIDEVCRGTQRTYRVEGEQTSTWNWTLKDELDAEVNLSGVTISSFTDTNASGETIYGSEIRFDWDIDPAIYSLSVEQTSTFGCENIELGTIEVFPAPEANLGEALTVCAGNDVSLTEVTAANYLDLIWTSDGDGAFNDPSLLNPTYSPGINDIATGTVNLTLTANGLISGTGCLPAESTTQVTIYPIPELVITNPSVVCEPETIDLENPDITNGSTLPSPTTLTYWEDAATTIALVDYNNVVTSGTYYIKAESEGECVDIEPVEVTVNPLPLIVITDPEPVCEPATIDLTDASVTAGSDADLVFTYWEDIDATIELMAPGTIITTGIYYIKGENTLTGCFDIKEVNAVINPQPILTITNPDAVCEPTTINLSDASIIAGSSIPTGSVFSYWADADTTIALTNYATIDISDTYYIKVQAPGGCFDIEPVEVVVNPLPNLVITDPEAVCEPTTVDLTEAEITSGSDANLVFTYWEDIDATIAIADYNTIAISGTYYIKGENTLTGCYDTKEVNVTIHTIPKLIINDPEPVCEPTTVDLADAEITNGSDADLAFTYWENTDATIELTNYNDVAVSGTYYIKATNPITSCEDIKEVHVTVYEQPLVVTNNPTPVCEPKTINLTLAEVTAGSDADLIFTYWEDIDATIAITDYTSMSVSETYYIKGTKPATDCYDIKPVVVTVYPIPTLIINDPEAVCEPTTVDLENPSVTLGSDVDLSLSYWKDADATIPIADYNTITTTGTYYIKGTNDITSCFDIKEVHVVINEQPDLTVNHPDPVCDPQTVDLSDPAILIGSIIPDGSDTTYWEDGAATIPLANYANVTTNGTYFIKVEAPGGCFDIDPVEVIVNPLPNLVITDHEPVCKPETIDLTDANIVAGSDVGLGYSYWEDVDATIALTNYNAIETSGTYYIKAEVPATGCYRVAEVHLLINEQPELLITNPNELCDGETVDLSDPAIISGSTIPVGSKITYWADSDTTISLTNYTTIDVAGTYYIKVQAPAGCFDVKPVDVVINPLPNLVITNPDELCDGETVDLADANIVAGSDAGLEYSYWEDENATTALVNHTAILANGTYYIKAANPVTGCEKIESVTIVINPIPNLVINDPEAICEPGPINLTESAITAGSDSNLDFSYWEDEDATVALTNPNAITTTGTYYIKGISQITNCESIVEPVHVIINEIPVLIITDPNEVCEPETIDLTNSSITAGSTIPTFSTTSYWEDAAATIAVADPENISQTGTYYIKVVAGSDCNDIKPVNITINKQPILTITDPEPVCKPETIDLTDALITAGSDTDLPLTYWQDEEATIPLVNYNAITSSDTYYIQATKEGLCPVVKPVTVIINIPPVLVINNPAEVCKPETIDLTDASIIAGSTYSPSTLFSYWEDPVATQQITNPSVIDESGTYYIKATAGDDCYDIKPVEVISNPQPSLTINNPAPVCEPETIDLTDATITPGVDPALVKTYWYDAFSADEIPDPTAIEVSGTYYIKVTSANGCPNTKPVHVIVNKPDELIFNMATVFCVNSIAPALPLTSEGGITGTWNPASILTNTIGKFDFIFTPDPGQCAVINTIEITITNQIVPQFDPTGPYCLGSTPPALPTKSKDNITGTWSPASISTDALGFYDFTFMPDPGQCATDTTITIEINQALSINAVVENVKCKGENTGAIQLVISGGSGSYSFSWSNGKTTRNIANLAGNQTYDIIVMDEVSHCSGEASVFVPEPSLNDTEAPIVTAPDTLFIQCDSDWPIAYTNLTSFATAGGTIEDNYGYNPITFALANQIIRTENNQMILERRYSVLDYCGNLGYDTHIIVASDDVKPTAICNTIEINVNHNGEYELTQSDIINIANGSSDNCTPVADLVLDFTPMKFRCDMIGQIVTGTLTVTDLSGNIDSCVATITIKDTDEPSIACQDKILYLDENGRAQLSINDVISNIYDNCGIDTTFISKTEFDCSDVGLSSETITAIDIHSNKATCDFNVTVVDTISPKVVCNDYTIALGASEYFFLTPEMVSSEISDECGIDRVELNKTNFGCDDIGIVPVTITVFDVNGNKSECSANVTVIVDNEKPLAEDDAFITVLNTSIVLPVLDNDSDPNGSIVPASINVVLAPAHGTLTVNSNHEFIYTPEPSFIGSDEFIYSVCDEGIPCYPLCDTAKVTIQVISPNNPPVANMDHFETGCYPIIENLLLNDFEPDGENLIINTTALVSSFLGNTTISANGDFRYEFERGISGQDWFIYEVCDDNYFPKCDTAIVYVNIFNDFDCDNVPDSIDIDDDNDGIIDVEEGDMTIDSDNDGIPNSLDIDSDGDGVPDNIEAQAEGHHISISGIDENHNGLDDAYETDSKLGINPVDTDRDDTPDYLDQDSDNDGVPDNIEGFDIGAKGIAEILPFGNDDDGDGLDNAFDFFFGGFDENNLDNPFGANTHLQDFDGDGIRDWRDTDDDDDEIPTLYEDLNNNGIFYDDDLDFDGHPEYLDYRGDCSMFIPEGFSPDGDGIHDYFQIYCIEKYPNAKMMIFDKSGFLLFEKDHYGNLEYWGSHQNAWWNGETIQNHQNPQQKVVPDVYMYILDKGNKNLERGFVMVSY